MSGYRKRRSTDSLGGDSKRVSYESCDYRSHIKQESNSRVSNNGRQNYAAVPESVQYNYYSPVAPGALQSAVVCKPQQYYNNDSRQYGRYFNSYKSTDTRNESPTRNYNSSTDAIATMYDRRRQMNFKHEVYINSLRQSEPRYVNINELRQHLSDIDIRYLHNNWFTTALDLTLELESSLKYFVDTRNELVFLRKLQRQHYVPFSYNEINIQSRYGLYNRINFLEDESAYRSHRMNQLFDQLQSVVIPSIIDDIRYVHSISYEKSWTNRARYWFSLFKHIRREKGSEAHARRPRRSNTDEVDDTRRIKSEVISTPQTLSTDVKSVKIENVPVIQSKDTISMEQEDKNIQTMSNIVEKTIESDDLNNILEPVRTAESETVMSVGNVDTPLVSAENDDKAQLDEENGIELSNSLVIIEPNVSLVTVADDDHHDSSNNDNPPEGVNEN